jgi:predicted aminopeptidase
MTPRRRSGPARPRRRRRHLAPAALVLVGLLAACGTVRYVTQVAVGGATILCRRQPIEKVLRRADLPGERRRQLEAVLEMRAFAVAELGLPDNKSYRSYVELDRDVVTWNVVAAPELSVDPITWCFPIAGCVSYRGYFDEGRARAFASRLERRGHDVAITGAIAYSTLGWFADPVLDTFFRYPDWQLAGLIFHELSHQVVYLPGDTTFNESFATAVEELGVARWLEDRASRGEAAAADAARREERRFLEVLLGARTCLDQVFRGAGTDAEKRERKSEVLEDLRARLALLRASGELSERFDPWLERPLDNADLAAVADYEVMVPAFRRLFEESGSFPRFYRAVEELSELEPAAREERFAALAPSRGAIEAGDPCAPSSTGDRASPGTAARDRGSR